MTPVREALEPCPFCGSKMVAQGATAQKTISVWCMKCGTRGPDVSFPDFCDSVAQIELCHQRWNTRVAPGEPCAWMHRWSGLGTEVTFTQTEQHFPDAVSSPLYATPQPAAGWDEATNKFSEPVIETAIKAIKNWQSNKATSFTPTDILWDFGDVILKALRREAPAPADLSYVSQLIAENNELKDQLAARPDTAEARLREALDLLQLQQRGRAKALRLLDQQCEVSDPATLAQADACEECGNELKQALSTGDEAKESEGGCICQDQHRRGYCTEPGCPYAVRPSEPSPPADRREIVAQIIDPDAYEDAMLQDDLTPTERLHFSQERSRQRVTAERKAYAILAALDGGR